MDQQQFMNLYVENITTELAKEQKEKILMKTQLSVANARIEQLNQAVTQLQETVEQLKQATEEQQEETTKRTRKSA